MAVKTTPVKSEALVLLIISGAMIASFAVLLGVTNKISLARPRWNVPVIRTSNEPFIIEIDTNAPIIGTLDMSARITSCYGNFTLALSSISANGNSITAIANIPSGTINDTLYDLEVTVNGMADAQRHAVKVVAAYKPEFKVIVWSDPQVGFSQDYKDMWNDSYAFFDAMVDQANLINPEFVIITGDLTEVALGSEYRFIHDRCTRRLKVPVYAGPGNHDYFGTDEYKRWCRYFNFTFDYGPDYHFTYIDTGMNLDALRDHLFSWLQEDMATHAATPVKIIAGHAPPYECDKIDEPGDINRNFDKYNVEFIELCDRYNVTAYLYGHNHDDQLNIGNCTKVSANDPWRRTLFVQTNDGREDAGYRVITFKNHAMVNFTSLAANGTRRAYESLEAVIGKDPDAPRVTFSGNVSWQDESHAFTGADCLITNRFDYEYFTNATIRVSIIGTDAMFWSNATRPTTFISKKVSRADMAGVITVEVNFYLANATTTNIKIWSV
ncbi:MAG: metallophosphoesterase [Candidatus Sigynarchaeota archaeon]